MPHICPREDRILALKDATSHPDTADLNMVLYFPAVRNRTYRLWLLARAEAPEIRINDTIYRALTKNMRGKAWMDFGLIENLAENLGSRGFGQIAFTNIHFSFADESYCVITSQVQKTLEGSVQDVERMLWGITREEVGVSSITPSVIPVGESRTFTMRYEASDRGLPPGSFLRLCFPAAFAEPQMEDREKDGWLRIFHTDTPLGLYYVGASIESHEKNDVIYKLLKSIKARGIIRISYHSNFTYIHPESFGETDRKYWYSRLPPMAVAVAVDERLLFVSPLQEKSHRVEFVPTSAERLHLFLPGRRFSTETLSLTGVITDRFRNTPPAGWLKPSVKLLLEDSSRSNELCELKMSFATKCRFDAPLPRLDPGLYRCKAVDAANGRILALSNPLMIMGQTSRHPRIFWGDIHAHSEMSDGSGDFADMFRHARDFAKLDFAAGADHACYFSDNQWLWMQEVVNSFNRKGSFITLIGYEWAGKQGHRNIYTYLDRLELFRGMYPPTSCLDSVYAALRGRADVVAGPHVDHTREFYDCHDPAVQRFMEIYSMWGNYENLAFDILNRGATIGLTGGGDNHEGHLSFSVEDRNGQGSVPHTFARKLYYKSGITAALLEQLSRKELIEALRNRRTYATTGPRILLDFYISGIPMGSEGTTEGLPDVWVEIHACDTIDSVQIIRDGRTAHVERVRVMDCTVRWQDDLPVTRRTWYCIRVDQADGEKAWSSPIWIEP